MTIGKQFQHARLSGVTHQQMLASIDFQARRAGDMLSYLIRRRHTQEREFDALINLAKRLHKGRNYVIGQSISA